ncbi:MAG: ATP-dependent DNA helicase DinG [Pseudomonadota bacterium]
MNATAPPVVALSDELKETIQTAYRAWLAARGFNPRRGQREMIAQVARTLAADSQRIAVIEAGTGTGKTAGYCLAAIPTAAALQKTIVLSTATVALQEQVTLHDIPDLKENAELNFSVALAKGRGRYLCLKRLDDHLKYQDQQEMALFQVNDGGVTEGDHIALYQSMLDSIGRGAWDGELDSWSDEMPDGAWAAVTTDHRGCSNNRCSFFKQCPFFRARNRLEGTDVIVANHDLVLADLALGGGAVLPEPEECIFILDEAHHLADKTQSHFSARARMQGTISWLEQVSAVLGSLTQRFARPDELVSAATAVAGEAAALRGALEALAAGLHQLDYEPRDEALDIHRFTLGEVPAELRELAAAALPPVGKICDELERVHGLVQDAVAGESNWQNAYEAEDWLVPVGQLQTRALAAQALLHDYVNDSPYRYARWVNRTDTDVELVSAPIEPGHILEEVLWQRAYGVICTSATLSAMGRFDRFLERSGLPMETTQVRIPSPFNYPEIATFSVPAMQSDPRDFDAHSAEVTSLLPELLAAQISALVLFTSWRQLNAVVKALPEALSKRLLVQGEAAKQVLIRTHRARIDRGEHSYLFGLASFSEGLDLPDDYCRHVIIVKLPFAVPDDPVDQAIAEWAEARGRNAFYEISVPDAALKLVQACGRLIRHEQDHGQITMLDKRIVTQRYGKAILQSLPRFNFQLTGN